jgi:hypothetical protein
MMRRRCGLPWWLNLPVMVIARTLRSESSRR